MDLSNVLKELSVVLSTLQLKDAAVAQKVDQFLNHKLHRLFNQLVVKSFLLPCGESRVNRHCFLIF